MHPDHGSICLLEEPSDIEMVQEAFLARHQETNTVAENNILGKYGQIPLAMSMIEYEINKYITSKKRAVIVSFRIRER